MIDYLSKFVFTHDKQLTTNYQQLIGNSFSWVITLCGNPFEFFYFTFGLLNSFINLYNLFWTRSVFSVLKLLFNFLLFETFLSCFSGLDDGQALFFLKKKNFHVLTCFFIHLPCTNFRILIVTNNKHITCVVRHSSLSVIPCGHFFCWKLFDFFFAENYTNEFNLFWSIFTFVTTSCNFRKNVLLFHFNLWLVTNHNLC